MRLKMRLNTFGVKSLGLALIIMAVVAFGVVFLSSKDTQLSSVTNDGKYCSPEGKLSHTQPIQSHRSYCVKFNNETVTFKPNIPSDHSFTIVDDKGEVTKDFAVTHTKRMHVIIVRDDLQHFQHVHPDFDDATGVFTLRDLTFPENGIYRIFADFAPESAMKDPSGIPLGVTISADVKVGGRYAAQSLGSEERIKTFGKQQVVLSIDEHVQAGTAETLSFQLSEGGQRVTDLEEYLGALGHSVILREDTLDFIHTHPLEEVNAIQDGQIGFMVTFPEAGRYKIFTQFQRNGEVFTTDFVVSVGAGEIMPESIPVMDDSRMGH